MDKLEAVPVEESAVVLVISVQKGSRTHLLVRSAMFQNVTVNPVVCGDVVGPLRRRVPKMRVSRSLEGQQLAEHVGGHSRR